MLRKIRTLATLILITSMLTVTAATVAAAAPKVGTPIGDVLYSDVLAYINNYAIPISNISGRGMVVVEDLANYGFDVVWNGTSRTLTVEPNAYKDIKPLTVEMNTKPVGSFKCKYLYTDVITYLSGELVECFNIGGSAMIDFELLAKYGNVRWNGATRELRLVITDATGNSTTPSPVPAPAPSPEQGKHQFDMNDPNVKKHPIYATAKSAEELVADYPSGTSGGWQFTTDRITAMKNEDPDYMFDGLTFYDWRMKPIQEWVDRYLASNGLSYQGKTDYEKTAIIRQIAYEGPLEEFIGLWMPNFRFTSGDCVPRSQAVYFLMLAMDFELFVQVGCYVGVSHSTNAYWDATVGAVRFVDANALGVWNLFADELDERGMILD